MAYGRNILKHKQILGFVLILIFLEFKFSIISSLTGSDSQEPRVENLDLPKLEPAPLVHEQEDLVVEEDEVDDQGDEVDDQEDGVKDSLSEKVNEIKGEDLPEVEPYACVKSAALGYLNRQIKFDICVKPFEIDQYISKDIYNKGVFERNEVELVLELIANYPTATFLDIGSNIGMFSTAVASTSTKVVAVDPVKTNLAYIRKSTSMFGSEKHVRYIQNAVSDEGFKLVSWLHNPKNEGSMNFISEDEAKTKPKNEIGETVDSARFQDILAYIGTATVIVKIDIEVHECKALSGYFNKPNKTTFIPYLVMEWVFISQNTDNQCPPEKLQLLIKGFTDSGYYPMESWPKGKKLSLADESNWNNVLWVHKDAKMNW